MRRRDVLATTAAGVVGLAGLSGSGQAHPGPYRPYAALPLDGAKEAVVGDDGSTVFVAATSGFAVVDVSARSDPQVLAERRRILADRDGGPLQGIQDVKVDGDRLAVVGPANPARGDVLHGMAVYDVADPAAPTFVGFHETTYPVHNCFVRDGVAYLTANDGATNPLVMVDVSGDELAELGRYSITEHEPGWADVAPSVWAIHDCWVQDGLAYVAHWDAGTWILDVSDPSAVEYVSHVGAYEPADVADLEGTAAQSESYQLPGNSHYAMVDDDGELLAVGREAWDQTPGDGRDGGPGGIDLLDVSDPANPERISTIEAPPSPEPSIGGIWTTSHNFDLRDGWLYTSWYRGGVKIFDVTDPAEPVEIAAWRDPARTEFWTAKRATGCFVAASRRDPSADAPGGARLYTFPDHRGFQADPPAMNATATDDGTWTPGNGTLTGTASATTGSGGAATTGSGGTGPTTAPGAAGVDGTAEPGTDATTTGGQAGFGVGAALVGAGVAAWNRLRRE